MCCCCSRRTRIHHHDVKNIKLCYSERLLCVRAVRVRLTKNICVCHYPRRTHHHTIKTIIAQLPQNISVNKLLCKWGYTIYVFLYIGVVRGDAEPNRISLCGLTAQALSLLWLKSIGYSKCVCECMFVLWCGCSCEWKPVM